ncbi:MAG: acyl-CoA synthetase [Calditrichae bacterium]|nr:acyl-CoA synthetase [Calditrichia bacterium]
MSQIATMSDILAIEKVPLSERKLPASTLEMLRRGSELAPDNIALSFFLQGGDYANAVHYTFRELLGRIHQTANLLHDLGIGETDVVSLILPNLPQTHFLLWGGEAAGIVNPINPLLEAEQYASIMNAAGTKLLATLAPFPRVDIWQKVDAIRREVPSLKMILQVDLGQYLGGLKKIAVRLLTLGGSGRERNRPQEIYDFDRLLDQYPADRLVSKRKIAPTDLASCFHTGGTTGTPKLARHTHFNEVFDAWSAALNLELNGSKNLFCGLPLFHVNGAFVTGLIPWSKGARVIMGTPQGYRGDGVMKNFWKIVEHYRIHFFSGVPTVYSTLLDIPVGGHDISSLEFALCGAAPLPVEVLQEFETRTGLTILEGYGLTEGTCVNCVNPPAGERRVGSIGFRLPYQEMKTVRLDGQGGYERDCDTDEIGLVIIRGPNVFAGYKDEHHNHDAWIDTADGRGPWLNTGDLGRRDAEGYFWLTGRRKEIIIRGGHNIDPQLIEGALHQHPAVALAAAVGRPDPRVGEVPVAYVELKADRNITPEELIVFSRKHIEERAAIPRDIRIIPRMPQTAVGKIFKPALRQREIEEVYREEVRHIKGVAAVVVTVCPDRIHGLTARIEVTLVPGAQQPAVVQKIAHVLGKYTVHYQAEFR